MWWHQTTTDNTARGRARDGLESNEKSNRPGIRFLVQEVLYQLSISTSHPSILAPPVFLFPWSTGCSPPPLFCLSLSVSFCRKRSLCEVFPNWWVVLGSVGWVGGWGCVWSFILWLLYHYVPCEGNNLSFSNCILRLPHNGFKRVRFLESQSCVLVSVLSLSRVWVGHCWCLRVGEEVSGEVERCCGGCLALECSWRRRRMKSSLLSIFLFSSGDPQFLLVSPFLFSLTRYFNKMQPDSSSIFNSVTFWLCGFKALFPGLFQTLVNLPCFLTNKPYFPSSLFFLYLISSLVTHTKNWMFTSLDSPLTLLGTHTKYKGALFSV